jgi:hypothetical protein
MRAGRRLNLEPLEDRSLLSADVDVLNVYALVASTAAVDSSSQEEAISAEENAENAAADEEQQEVAATTSEINEAVTQNSQADSSRWDWLAGTVWYVPTENLLAYATPSDLSDPTPVADQTLWYIDDATRGAVSGRALAKLSFSSTPTSMAFAGVVTPGGQVRLEFQTSTSEPTTGIGQMRFVDGRWRIEMQMATPGSLLVTHWAYMSQQLAGETPPEPIGQLIDHDLLSPEWRWLAGTRWAIAGTSPFGTGPGTGVFEIDSYRNGYFWGAGTNGEPFNVLGSVTPEGNLLLLVCVEGGEPQARTGRLERTSAGGYMVLRSYEGQPAVGSAWTLDRPRSPSVRQMMASVASVLE